MESPIPTAPADPRSVFLEEKTFKSRTVLIFGTITDVTAADAARRLIALDADSSELHFKLPWLGSIGGVNRHRTCAAHCGLPI